jgi:hypothetical protein
MKHKKLTYSNDVMEEFNLFFDEAFKVVEVGQISTTIDTKELCLSKCPYDGMALNKQDQSIYLKFINNKNQREEFILLQDETVIIDDNGMVYKTNDTGLKTISKGNVEDEVKRIKDFHLLIMKNK